MNIIDQIENEVRRRCQSPNNFFGEGIYDHIKSVAYHSVELAKVYGGDQEVCELAGWLHDIASITSYDLYEDHHIHGGQIAEELLISYDYPQDKINLIKECIKNHRGSKLSEKLSKEEICVADADAISHFDNIPSLLYLAFVKRKLDLNEGKKFVKDKLERSFNKMSVESQHYYEEKIKIMDALF